MYVCITYVLPIGAHMCGSLRSALDVVPQVLSASVLRLILADCAKLSAHEPQGPACLGHISAEATTNTNIYQVFAALWGFNLGLMFVQQALYRPFPQPP